MSINQIFEEICRKGSKYDIIIDNIIAPNFHLKDKVISELAEYWYRNPEKTEQIYKEKWFDYHFINAVRNQVKSNTSSLYRKFISPNPLPTNDNNYEPIFEDEYLDEDTMGCNGIEEKKEFERKLELINNTLKKCKKITWFEEQMFREYFMYDKTYRQIEDEYGIDHVLVWKSVKKVNDILKNKLT